MLLFKVGIGAVFDSASAPLWSFGGASEIRVKSLRIRIDIVTVLRVFKVHFLGYSDFVLVIRIYFHASRAKCSYFGLLWSVCQPGAKRRQLEYLTAPPGSVYGGIDAPRVCPVWVRRGPDRAPRGGLAGSHHRSSTPSGLL